MVYGVGQSPASNVNFFAYPGDLSKWIAVGFTGKDTDATHPVTWSEFYSNNGVTNTNSRIWKAVSCLYSYTTGTNLDTPIAMAQQYFSTNGRTGVKKGITLETDGTPQAGDGGAHYTCAQADATATAAKAAGIEIFTIGFGIGSATCPKYNNSGVNCSNPSQINTNQKGDGGLVVRSRRDAPVQHGVPEHRDFQAALLQRTRLRVSGGSVLRRVREPGHRQGQAHSAVSHAGGHERRRRNLRRNDLGQVIHRRDLSYLRRHGSHLLHGHERHVHHGAGSRPNQRFDRRRHRDDGRWHIPGHALGPLYVPVTGVSAPPRRAPQREIRGRRST